MKDTTWMGHLVIMLNKCVHQGVDIESLWQDTLIFIYIFILSHFCIKKNSSNTSFNKHFTNLIKNFSDNYNIHDKDFIIFCFTFLAKYLKSSLLAIRPTLQSGLR